MDQFSPMSTFCLNMGLYLLKLKIRGLNLKSSFEIEDLYGNSAVYYHASFVCFGVGGRSFSVSYQSKDGVFHGYFSGYGTDRQYRDHTGFLKNVHRCGSTGTVTMFFFFGVSPPLFSTLLRNRWL